MENKRSKVVSILELIIALPLVYLLWILAVELIEMHGFIVIPVGAAAFFVISLLVDKFFWRQSAQIEQALERKLSVSAEKQAK